ncbi:unnamed protein product [Closterium sp. NIES-54]
MLTLATGGTAGAAAAGGAFGASGGSAGARVAGAAGPGGAGTVGGPAGVKAAGGAGAAGPRGAHTGGTGAAWAVGAAGVGAVGVGAVATGGAAGAGADGGPGAGGAVGVVAGAPGAEGTIAVYAVFGGATRPRPYYVPLLQQVLGLSPSTSPTPPLLSPPPVQTQSRIQPASPVPASPESCPESLVHAVCTGHRVLRPRPRPVPGTHSMTLRPSTAPQRVPLPSPPASSLPALADPESDSLRAASPTVTCLLATVVTDPSFESTVASDLVAEVIDFAANCPLDYAASLVAESESASVCPPSVGGECALGMDVLEDRREEFECFATAVPHLVSMLLAPEGDPDAPDIRTPRSYAEVIEGPYSSQWQATMDAEMASWKSTGTYIDDVPPRGANIVSGMWNFRVKRPPGSPPVFKARYVARGFSQRQGVDYFQTFSPTPKMTTLRCFLTSSLHEEIWLRRPLGFTGTFPPDFKARYVARGFSQRQGVDFFQTFSPTLKMTTLRVLLHVAAQRDYELHSLDFSTAFLQGSLQEIWLRCPPGSTASFPAHDLTSHTLLAFWLAWGAEPGGAASGGAEPGGAATGGAEPGGAELGGTVLGGAEPGGAATRGAEPGGAATGGAEPGGASPGGAELRGAPPGGSPGASSLREPLSPQELRKWFAWCWRRAASAGGSSATEGAAVAGPGGACTTTAGGPAGGPPGAAGGSRAAGGAAGEGAPAGGTGAVPPVSGVAARPRPYFVPLLEQVLRSPPSPGVPPSLECPQPVQSQLQLPPTSPLPAPSPYTGPTGGLAERREPASRPASPVRAARTSLHNSRQRPPPVPGTHRMSLRPSTAPLRVPLPSPPESSLPALADPESDSLRAASPTVTRLLATVVTGPSFESTALSALVTKLVEFAARCRLDYTARLVTASESVCPPSVEGECALGTDVFEDRQEEFQCLAAASPHLVSVLLTPEGDPDAPDIPTPRSYAEAIEGPYSSQWQAAMDAEMASWKSTGTYVDAVPPSGANIVSGMWIFRVKRPPGSPPVFKARYVARGFSQRQGVDYFQTFSPTPKMTTLRAPREWHDTLRTTLAALGFAPYTADPSLFLRTDTSLPPFYILVYVDDLVFATADTAGLAHVKSELQKRHTCTDLGELRGYLGLQITRDRARRTITLTQSHMVQQVLQRFGFTYSSPQATPLLTRHSLSALPSDESVESSGPYPELVGCLMYLMTCTRPDLAYPLGILARYVAPGRHRPEHMAAAKRVLHYLCSTSGMGLVLGGRSPVVLTGHADASWADDQATQRSSQGYTFSLGSGSVSWRATRSSSVLGSSCEAEIYAGAMDAQELRWLTYLLTNLGEPPRSPPVLYVDNKAMLALCREQRLEHRTKHIALRYFLARELQQRAEPCRPAKPRRPAAPRRQEPSCAAQPSRAALPSCAALLSSIALPAPLAAAVFAATAATFTTAATAAMASPTVLTFDAEGRAVEFDVWVDDVQLFLQCDSKDGVSLFEHTSGVSPAPAATANSTVRSHWTTRDAVARLAVRSC